MRQRQAYHGEMTDHPEAQADETGDEARADRVDEERQDAGKRDRNPAGDEGAPTEAHTAPPTEAIILKSSD